jgi:hypothetical protein
MVVSNESARSQIPVLPMGQAEIATFVPFATKGSRRPKPRNIRSRLALTVFPPSTLQGQLGRTVGVEA